MGTQQAKAMLKRSTPDTICLARCTPRQGTPVSATHSGGAEAQVDLDEIANSVPDDALLYVPGAVNTGDLVPENTLASEGSESSSSDDGGESGDEQATAALSDLAGAVETSVEDEQAEAPRRRALAQTVSKGVRAATGWLLNDLAFSRDAALRSAAQVRRATVAVVSPPTSPRARRGGAAPPQRAQQHLAATSGAQRRGQEVV